MVKWHWSGLDSKARGTETSPGVLGSLVSEMDVAFAGGKSDEKLPRRESLGWSRNRSLLALRHLHQSARSPAIPDLSKGSGKEGHTHKDDIKSFFTILERI